MSSSAPSWLEALQPIHKPSLERFSPYSPVLAWHVRVEFTPWRVPPGASLTGSQTWNGKALLEPTDPRVEASVGEVEVAERLQRAFPARSSYWTAGSGHPPAQWRERALTPERRQRSPWLLELDQRLREADTALRGNHRGWPDVVSWKSGPEDLWCVEYKGPVTSNPEIMDSVSPEQDAWFNAAVRLRALDVDRYAVVYWVPSAEDRALLLEQARARVRRRPPAGGSRREPRSRDVDRAATVASHGDGKLHRRTIRKVLKEKTGLGIVSHIDGTIDLAVASPSDAAALCALVDREVRRLGYEPTVEIVTRGNGSAIIRVTTPETLAQRGRGAHRI